MGAYDRDIEQFTSVEEADDPRSCLKYSVFADGVYRDDDGRDAHAPGESLQPAKASGIAPVLVFEAFALLA